MPTAWEVSQAVFYWSCEAIIEGSIFSISTKIKTKKKQCSHSQVETGKHCFFNTEIIISKLMNYIFLWHM